MTIDLWDHRSYDAEITVWLSDRKELITGYYHDEAKKDAEIATRDRWEPLQPNPYRADFMAAREELGALMAKRTLRVFHYTRMSDSEIGALSADGIVPTSLEFLKARIARQVEQGLLTRKQGETIFANSPLHHTGYGVRKGFWTTTTPFHPSDSAVKLLVDHWGGESAYWLFTGKRDQAMIELLQRIGCGRVLEIALPLANANGGYAGFSVGEVVIKEYARTLGVELWPEGRDIHIEHSLPASRILRIHTEGEVTYNEFGRGYPDGYSCPAN